MRPQIGAVSPCLGGCFNYSNDGNIGWGNVGTNPGPIPGEDGLPCGPTYPTRCVATLPLSEACYTALAPNTPIGSGGHANSVSNVFVYSLQVGGSYEPVAYEYQTYSGTEYFQFDGQISISVTAGVPVASVSLGVSASAPYVAYNPNIAADFDETVALLGQASATPAGLLAQIVQTGMGAMTKTDCYSGH